MIKDFWSHFKHFGKNLSVKYSKIYSLPSILKSLLPQKRKMIRIWNLSKTVKFCTSRRKVDIDQYLQTQYLLTSNNHRSQSAGNNEALLLDRCALRKFHATDCQNTRDHISSDSKSKRACSNWVLCIPFILSGSPSAPFVISEIAPN